MLALRGVVQPLIERRTAKNSATLLEAMRLAESSEEEHAQDVTLGIAAEAIEPAPRESVGSKSR
jgi:hypothetical protein